MELESAIVESRSRFILVRGVEERNRSLNRRSYECKIDRDRRLGTIKLSIPHYIDSLISRLQLTNSYPVVHLSIHLSLFMLVLLIKVSIPKWKISRPLRS